ncbi:DUF6644 family protein [Steroidobacter flavus]|uniref:DUF6644 family protein n=1 Tax=Steroidobacter flavus TaxID=1842136 RepID=A0ABV8T339_9GAMM
MLEDTLATIENLRLATAIREEGLLFPWIESIHVLALVLVVGFILIVDLRLIGLASKKRGVAQLASNALPITWGAFAVAVISGSLLFISNAVSYWDNVFFQIKLVLILLAGVNMFAFHHLVAHDMSEWQTPDTTPVLAKAAGAISMLLWIGVVICGRWIGFV